MLTGINTDIHAGTVNTTSQFKQQAPRNALFQLLSFITQVAVGVCMVPYLLRNLGVAAYGIVLIAGTLTSYVNLISTSVSSAVNRNLSIALQGEQEDEVQKIFSTAFFSYLGIAVIQVPLLVWIISQIAGNYRNPRGDPSGCCGAGWMQCISVPRKPSRKCFRGVNVCAEQAGFGENARYREGVLGSLGVVIVFFLLGASLRNIGYVYLVNAIIIFVFAGLYCSVFGSRDTLSIKHFEGDKVKEIIGVGGWLLVSQVGALLFLQMDVWICNRFIGPEVGGEYAALLQWPTLIRQGGALISSLLAPMIVIYFAKNEIQNLIRLTEFGVRIMSLLLAVPIAVLCVMSPLILRLWLGDAFVSMAPLVVIMVCHLVINVGVMPLLHVQLTTNRLKVPALLTLLMGVLNVGIAIYVVMKFEAGVYGVAIVGAVMLTVKNAIFTLSTQRRFYNCLGTYS